MVGCKNFWSFLKCLVIFKVVNVRSLNDLFVMPGYFQRFITLFTYFFLNLNNFFHIIIPECHK